MLYRPWWLFSFLILLISNPTCIFVDGDADFESVRVRMTEDFSGRRGDPEAKYWRSTRIMMAGSFSKESNPTAQWWLILYCRFTDRPLAYEDQKSNLSMLMRSYLFTMRDLGAETWIMHGTLLGWWWNRKILPWDSDIDVQVSASTIHFLASYYNMTVHTFQGRDYMLEINPQYINFSMDDELNMIDGRYIDTETGLFIDITTARPREGAFKKLTCKDGHEYEKADIFPLRDNFFEDQPVKIPYSYPSLLEEEYGTKSLINTRYQGHRFNSSTMDWERVMWVFDLLLFIVNDAFNQFCLVKAKSSPALVASKPNVAGGFDCSDGQFHEGYFLRDVDSALFYGSLVLFNLDPEVIDLSSTGQLYLPHPSPLFTLIKFAFPQISKVIR